MRAAEIARLLVKDAEAICERLLPNGKRQGHEWCVGDTSGSAGQSLRVHLSGDKAGIWKDFAEGSGGDLLDLWREVRDLSMTAAMDEARAYLGISKPEWRGIPDKRPQRPKCQRPKSAVKEWLEGRGLSETTLAAYRVAEQGEWAVFPSLWGDELMWVKLRHHADKRKMRVEPDSVPVLFGWQAISDDAREVVICEGEIDALSWYEMGVPALSVPNGAQGMSWVENEFDRLDRFDTIYLAFDMDDEGQKGAKKLAERLGIERCRLVDTSPAKDANVLLCEGCENATDFIRQAKPLDPAELKPAHSFVEATLKEFYPPEGEERGILPPWERLHGKLLFRPAELILCNGFNGHGKSQGTQLIALEAMFQGHRACIGSMELKPSKVLYRMSRQAAGLANGLPPEGYIRAIHDWWRDRLWIFDVVGTAKTKRLLDVFKYARQRYGIDCFVIDSLLKCGIDEDDYNGQKRFVEQLCDFKNEHDCTVFLVTHSRKGENEFAPSRKMDVRGSGTIADMADTLITFHRMKKKEEAVEKAQSQGKPVPEDVAKKPDALVICDKQRNGDWERKAGLWWHQNSLQFLNFSSASPRRYVEYQEAKAA